MSDDLSPAETNGDELDSSRAGPVLFAAVALGIVLFFMWLL